MAPDCFCFPRIERTSDHIPDSTEVVMHVPEGGPAAVAMPDQIRSPERCPVQTSTPDHDHWQGSVARCVETLGHDVGVARCPGMGIFQEPGGVVKRLACVAGMALWAGMSMA
ncbi:MAG: hypothetical protein DI562_11120, partial [Stenotrophomonas acidaminiphila]